MPDEHDLWRRLETLEGRLKGLQQQLNRIERLLPQMLHRAVSKDYYSPAEAAEILGKAEFTVREWCRQGRVQAKKRACGRGKAREWIISRQELTRIENEGLLPRAGGGGELHVECS